MKKSLPTILIVLLLAIIAFAYVQNAEKKNLTDTSNQTEGESANPKAPQDMSTREEAIAEAYKLYAEYKEEGTNFTNGPCLSNHVIPDWVVDIAHNPRTEVDNLPENQCLAYREGKAKHFVELDAEGKVIRAE